MVIRTPARTSVAKRTKLTKKARKPKGNNGHFLTVPRGFSFPKLYSNTHVYWENLAIQTTAGTGLGTYLFSCNGLFDPNTTGTGHQPMYFDQMTALYDHYNVKASKITWYVTCVGTYPLLVMTGIDDDASPVLSNAAVAGERPGSKTSLTTQYQMAVHTQSWSRDRAFGKAGIADHELQGSSSANPVEQQHYWICLYDNTAGAQTANVTVKIEYQAEWSELASMGLS